MDKQEARKKLKAMRNSLSSVFVSSASAWIAEKTKPLLAEVNALGIYVGVGNEVATIDLITWCLSEGKAVYCPRVHGDTMDFYPISCLNDLKPGTYGLLEPIGNQPCQPSAMACMVMPLVGFNEACQRIGQGKGYYDKYLKQCSCMKLGLAYECQKAEFTNEAHDIDADMIITEQHIYRRVK